jgi:hypothetical protein
LDEIGSAVYEEMSFKVKVYGRRTDGRRTKSDHKSSPCHIVTGELKISKNDQTIKKTRQIRKIFEDTKHYNISVWKNHRNYNNSIITFYFFVTFCNKIDFVLQPEI